MLLNLIQLIRETRNDSIAGTITGPKITGYRTGNLVLIVNQNLNRNHFFKCLKNLTKIRT